MYKFVFLFTFLLDGLLSAQKIPFSSDYQNLLPKNWKVIKEVSGDINKDLAHDIALVVEDTDPKNIKTNSGFGEATLNLNPRKLLVFFKKDNGYELVAVNDRLIRIRKQRNKPLSGRSPA